MIWWQGGNKIPVREAGTGNGTSCQRLYALVFLIFQVEVKPDTISLAQSFCGDKWWYTNSVSLSGGCRAHYAKDETLKLIYYPRQWEQIGVWDPTKGVGILNKEKTGVSPPRKKMPDKAPKIWTWLVKKAKWISKQILHKLFSLVWITN